jgi:hypothetical protein
MTQQPIIALPDPRREWLLHCTDSEGELGVCTIAVEKGAIVVYGPTNSEHFHLGPTGIAQFRAAFDEAIDVAEADLRAKKINLNG